MNVIIWFWIIFSKKLFPCNKFWHQTSNEENNLNPEHVNHWLIILEKSQKNFQNLVIQITWRQDKLQYQVASIVQQFVHKVLNACILSVWVRNSKNIWKGFQVAQGPSLQLTSYWAILLDHASLHSEQ